MITLRARSTVPALPVMALIPALAGCGDPYGEARVDCVDAINADRATLKLPPYARWNAEESCTDGQAEADFESDDAAQRLREMRRARAGRVPRLARPARHDDHRVPRPDVGRGPRHHFATHGHYINMSSTAYTMVSCGYYVESDGARVGDAGLQVRCMRHRRRGVRPGPVFCAKAAAVLSAVPTCASQRSSTSTSSAPRMRARWGSETASPRDASTARIASRLPLISRSVRDPLGEHGVEILVAPPLQQVLERQSPHRPRHRRAPSAGAREEEPGVVEYHLERAPRPRR